MDGSPGTESLQALIAALTRSLLRRLTESLVYAQKETFHDLSVLLRMRDETDADRQRLVQLLIESGGQPRPVAADIRSADFHYSRIETLLPRLLADQEQIAKTFDAAAARLTPGGGAIAAAIVEIARRQRAHADELASLKKPPSPVAS